MSNLNTNFSFDRYFTRNYGLGNKPTVSKLKKKPIVIGIIIAIASLALGFSVSPVVLLGLAISAIFIAPQLIKKSNQQKAANEWQAAYNTCRSTWDEKFDKSYAKIVSDMKIKESAMNALGIADDDPDFQIANPFSIYGSKFDDFYRTGVDGNHRTNHNQYTWIFFSKDQIHVYWTDFKLTETGKSKYDTTEFFYQDIVSVSTGATTVDIDTKNSLTDTKETSIVTQSFKLTVPGDKLEFAFTTTPEISASVTAMKNLIRDKKMK